MHARDSRRRAAAALLVAPLVPWAVALSAHAQLGADQAEDGSKTPPLPPPGEWVGPFPVPSSATKDAKQSGMTSLAPGRNYVFAVYTIERPRAEIARFYESILKTYQRSEGADGAVTLKTDEGSVRLSEAGGQTRIHITHGPQ